MFESKIFTLLHKTLDFRTQRQDLLTSNIANKDTPGYKAEDMVFEKIWRRRFMQMSLDY